MAKENSKLCFRDLNWVLKGAVIAGWVYLVLIVLNLTYTLIAGY